MCSKPQTYFRLFIVVQLYAGYGTNIRVGEELLYFFNVQICTILRFHLGN